MNPESNPMMPVILICMIGYIIGRLYAMVFEMAVDTSLQCFIIVEEQANSAQNEFVPAPMMGLLQKRESPKEGEKEGEGGNA